MNKIVAVMVLTLAAVQSQASAANSVVFVSVPTLDELGLVALTLVVAVAGGLAARRRKK
jgi:hypothetical protein